VRKRGVNRAAVLAYGVPGRPSPSFRFLSLALVLLMTTGAARRQEGTAQTVTGTWKGAAKLTNESPPTTCRYEGGEESVVIKLQQEEGDQRAIVRLDIPGVPGSGCPPLLKRYEATNVVVTGSAVAFLDPAGHEWTLALRASKLVGLVAWKGGGRDDALAEGYTPPGSPPPLTRLAGEVSLTRQEGSAVGEAPSGSPPETKTETAPAGAGEAPKAGKSMFWPAFLGANIVGLGAFYGIKKATDDDATSGTATCSPRFCVFGGLVEPCVCNINIVSGGSCGQTTNGVPFGGQCNDTTLPCQADLSCNNGVCDDRVGRCPF
jgi:hypothetical protein